MESFLKKFRLVFVPYLILLAVCLAAYSFCNWRLYLLRPSSHIWEAVILIVLPVVLAMVAVLIWLRPRLRLLTVAAPRTYPQFTLNMLSIMAVAIPIILFQYLLLSATSDLKKVHHPSDIANGKYYAVEEYAELKKYASMRFATTKTNKGRTLIYHQYFAMPLIDKSVFANNHFAEDTSATFMKLVIEGKSPMVWVCREYTLRVKKKDNTREKEDRFIAESKKDFYEKGFSTVTYMDRLGNNRLRNNYRQTIGKEGELIILHAQFTPFERRSDHILKWAIFGTLICMVSLLGIFGIFTWDEERLQAFEDKDRIW